MNTTIEVGDEVVRKEDIHTRGKVISIRYTSGCIKRWHFKNMPTYEIIWEGTSSVATVWGGGNLIRVQVLVDLGVILP